MSNRYSNTTQPLLRTGTPGRPSSGLRRTYSTSSVCSVSSDGSTSSGTSATGRSQSRRNSVQELATNPHALSCTSGAHKHACISCTEKIGRAYHATKSNGKPKPVKLPTGIARVPHRRASQETRPSNASPGICSKSKSIARVGLDRMKDACAICGVALSLPMVAGDYVCVIAGASVGILFVPFGIVAEMAALVDKPGSSVWRVPAFFGGLFGLLGYLFPPSIIASILGHVSIKRLVGSGQIADKTAMAIYALLNPGPALLYCNSPDCIATFQGVAGTIPQQTLSFHRLAVVLLQNSYDCLVTTESPSNNNHQVVGLALKGKAWPYYVAVEGMTTPLIAAAGI